MQAYQKYQRVNVSTADPLRVVIMLYEGAIKNLNQAMRLISAEGPAAGEKIGRTLDIVNYLRNSLDHENGGEISTNLDRLYDYMRDLLNKANIQRDAAPLQEAIVLLQTLLEGWRGIIHGQNTVNEANSTEPLESAAGAPPKSGLSLVG